MVDAKHLKYNGGYVRKSNMELYTVPEDFSLEDFIDKYLNLDMKYRNKAANMLGEQNAYLYHIGAVCIQLIKAFKPGGEDELQRRYNGIVRNDGDGLVHEFTPIASFVFGLACYLLGVDQYVCERGGGALNYFTRYIMPHLDMSLFGEESDPPLTFGNIYIDVSGTAGNNPKNANNINRAYEFATERGLRDEPPFFTRKSFLLEDILG